ncbi:hypothetical protein M0802_000859 [Mischocyttarus mexicanus]|nr:hypothetical protein M0802_000859 [Mischocyttarus mexicanus]
MTEKLFRPWVNVSAEKMDFEDYSCEDKSNSTVIVSKKENNIKSSYEGNEGTTGRKNRKEEYVVKKENLNGSEGNFVNSFNALLLEDSEPRFFTNQFPNIVTSTASTVNLPPYDSPSFMSYLNYLTPDLYHQSEMFPLIDKKNDPYLLLSYLNTFTNKRRMHDMPPIPQVFSNSYYNTLPTYNASVEKAVEMVNLQDVAAKQIKKLRPKKFRCEYCDVAFSNNGQLKGHVRIHTGERPYKCDSEGCGKSFTRNEELTRHKRIHTGLRPHSCSVCGKKFGRKDHLKKHTKTHENRDFLYHVSNSLNVLPLGIFPSLA